MGSDGLWDVLDNQTVVNIVHQYDDVGEAAKELLKVRTLTAVYTRRFDLVARLREQQLCT